MENNNKAIDEKKYSQNSEQFQIIGSVYKVFSEDIMGDSFVFE